MSERARTGSGQTLPSVDEAFQVLMDHGPEVHLTASRIEVGCVCGERQRPFMWHIIDVLREKEANK